jgi:hypothetical protein
MEKLFHKPSIEHGGISAGTKVRLIKDHHEISGELSAGSEYIVDAIIHFPTRCRLKENDKIWTVPMHSIEKIADESKEAVDEKNGEADD